MSERRFYQKITDIYSTALDYDPKAKMTQTFFATVQNKLNYSVHGHTAAELIVERADANKEHMGLTTWDAYPDGKIQKYDVSVAKNYLQEKEIRQLERLVSSYLDYAEMQAERHIPMTMQDWNEKLNGFLTFMDYDVLQDAGKVSAGIAKMMEQNKNIAIYQSADGKIELNIPFDNDTIWISQRQMSELLEKISHPMNKLYL